MSSQDVFFEILTEMFTDYLNADEDEKEVVKYEILEFINNPNE